MITKIIALSSTSSSSSVTSLFLCLLLCSYRKSLWTTATQFMHCASSCPFVAKKFTDRMNQWFAGNPVRSSWEGPIPGEMDATEFLTSKKAYHNQSVIGKEGISQQISYWQRRHITTNQLLDGIRCVVGASVFTGGKQFSIIVGSNDYTMTCNWQIGGWNVSYAISGSSVLIHV